MLPTWGVGHDEWGSAVLGSSLAVHELRKPCNLLTRCRLCYYCQHWAVQKC